MLSLILPTTGLIYCFRNQIINAEIYNGRFRLDYCYKNVRPIVYSLTVAVGGYTAASDIASGITLRYLNLINFCGHEAHKLAFSLVGVV